MHALCSLRYTLAVLLAGMAGVKCSDLGASDASIPKKLTPGTYEAIKARTRLTPEDLAWQQVHWRDGYFAGLIEAQAADKPLFYWLYAGDPRGNC